ncbi:MAG: HD-GYP domain-containing protein [Methylotenera sp.]
MFVCELDRPWLGTPFMLEGLLIEDDEQIATIASLCQFVYVDRTVSVGNCFIAPPKEQVAINRDGAIVRLNPSANLSEKTDSSATKPNNTGTTNAKFSFFDVLKEIKASNQSAPSTSVKKDASSTVMLNVQYTKNVSNTTNFIANKNNEISSLASQIKTDISNFISGVTIWGGKQKKLKTTINKDTLKEKFAKEPEQDDRYRITIFEEAPPVEVEISRIYPVYERLQFATRKIFEALAQGHKIDLSIVSEFLNSIVDSIERNPDALIWLAKLKQTDDHAYNHAMNVSVTLMAFANFMSLPKKQVMDLGLSGLLEDIGKTKISSDLLHKKEKITEAEFELLKKHVNYALELLEVTDTIPSSVILTVSQHHERIDGSGYPYQLMGKQISLTGQMAGLIDTYCALTTNKVYATGISNQSALEQIHTLRDIKFSGVLIDQLVQFLGIYPVSSLVELNTGEVGVVIQQNSVRRLLPRVMVLLNPDKTKNEHPATINLLNAPSTPTGEPYQILRGLAPDSYGLNASNYYG